MPRLLRVIDSITNWYIRFNRRRLKVTTGLGLQDTQAALTTLCEVIFTLIRALAPFTPFIAEHIYRLLKPYLEDRLSDFQDSRSVHFIPYPTVDKSLFDEVIERKVSRMQKVIQLARMARERADLPLKTPLPSLVVIADSPYLSDVDELQSYIKEELNIREVILSSDEDKYNIILEARVDWPTLGKKLKKSAQIVRKALPNLNQMQLRQYLHDKKMTIEGIDLEENDLNIVRVLDRAHVEDVDREDGPKWEVSISENVITLLDTSLRPDLLKDGLVRDIINRVQRMRKTAGLVPTDDVRMQYCIVSNPDNIDVDELITSRQALFESSLRRPLEALSSIEVTDISPILQEDHYFGKMALKLGLARI